MNRQKLALALLVVAFAGSLVYSYIKFPRQREAAPQGPATRSAAPAAARKGSAPPPKVREEGALHLDLLDQAQPHAVGFRRNIFSPIFREETKAPAFKPLPPPPKPVTKALPPPPPAQVQPPAQPAPPPPPTAEQLAEAELSKFTFLGFLKKNGEKTVFLSNNNEIFLAKKGATIGTGGNFTVTDVTDDAITIKPVAGGREVVIPLVENRPLSKRRSKWATP